MGMYQVDHDGRVQAWYSHQDFWPHCFVYDCDKLKQTTELDKNHVEASVKNVVMALESILGKRTMAMRGVLYKTKP